MLGKIKHVAILTENCILLGKFYETLFAMKGDQKNASGRERALTVGDGYVGLNLNRRNVGRPARLDHFGIEVEDVEVIFKRLREEYPLVKYLKRPSNRPFAGITTHDPEGNVFDLSQPGMTNRRDIYEGSEREAHRCIHHITLRALNSASLARFYCEIFEFQEEEKALEDPSIYLSDGRVTLVIKPWNITDYEGTGIVGPGLDHIGFRVESLEAVKRELKTLRESNSPFAPKFVEEGSESNARVRLVSTCRYGQNQLWDRDGVLIDIFER